MVHSYSRFEPAGTFGVIASPQCNVIFDFTGNIGITGSLQSIGLWNLRQGSLIGTLSCDQHNYPYTLTGDACIVCRSADKCTIAVGYTNGDIRVFNYINKTLIATLRSHKTAVITLCYDNEGGLLASGGADSDILIWDVVSMTAICKFRGHKDGVTGVAFLKRGSQQLLLSVSKDTLLKVWDISTQYCIQTIVGHRCEIWSIGITPSGIILTGSADEYIRGYRPLGLDEESMTLDNESVIEYYGCVKRNFSNNNDRCVGIHCNTNGSVIGIQTTSKIVEIYRVRSESDIKKKTKRRLKRVRDKKAKNTEKKSSENISSWDDDRPDADVAMNINTDLSLADSLSGILSDELELYSTIRFSSKVRGLSFNPNIKDSNEKILVSLLNNTLEVYSIPPTPTIAEIIEAENSNTDVNKDCTKVSILELPGHRSDVKGLSLSSDGSTVATCTSDGIKVWSTITKLCLRTCKTDEGLSITYVPNSRFVVIGTKGGKLQIADTASGDLVADIQAHNGAIHTVAVRPDGKGFMSGGTDREVKFWDFNLSNSILSATLTRELTMPSDVLCVKYSYTLHEDRLLIGIGLLDNTIKLFYDDSLKFFLSLYGHKLPVLCLDMSHDSKLLITGSADKTVKIWGLDFGDCHRSLIAHEDSVTSVRFQPDNHYFFSCGKDGIVKYWDGDKFEQILILPGHTGPAWCLDVSQDGNYCISGGQDRSLRIWEKTDDLVFLEEEKERALEAIVERTAETDQIETVAIDTQAAVNNIKSIESVKGGEMLMEAMDLYEAEIAELQVRDQKILQGIRLAKRNPNPLMLGLTPFKYMIRALRLIKAPDLEQALLILPFHYVRRLVNILLVLAEHGLDLELCVRCAVFLLRCHQPQILTTQALLDEILSLQKVIRVNIDDYRTLIGTNMAGLRYVANVVEEKKISFDTEPEVAPLPPLKKSKKSNYK